MMAGKLGLVSYRPDVDEELIDELLALLQAAETDMTLFFRRLARMETTDDFLNALTAQSGAGFFGEAYYVPEQLTPDYRRRLSLWLERYVRRLQQDGVADDIRRRQMNAVNPKYVLRNYLAQLAIDKAEQGDFDMVNELLELLRHPYDEQPGRELFAARRPDWARTRAGCSMLSCSS